MALCKAVVLLRLFLLETSLLLLGDLAKRVKLLQLQGRLQTVRRLPKPGTTVNQVVFAGRTRLRGIYIVNAGAAGDLDFKNGSSNGSTVMKLMTTGTAATADYPDIPDEGVLCSDGAYVNFTTTDVTAFTVFFN